LSINIFRSIHPKSYLAIFMEMG